MKLGALATALALLTLERVSRLRGNGDPPAGGKTWADLREELRWLGRGVLGTHILGGTLRSCVSTAHEVANYLRERGFEVSNYGGGGGYLGHFDLAVKVGDEWVGVDPTYMQFHCRYDLDDDESPEILRDLVDHLRAAEADGLSAFEITRDLGERPAGGYEPPVNRFGGEKTWRDVFERRRRYVDLALEGKGRMGKKLYARLLREGWEWMV